MLPLAVILACVAILCDVTAGRNCSRVATFNAGLLHNVEKNYEDRIPDVSRELRLVDADVICLQEVWLESDLDRMLKRLESRYPHHYSKIHYRQGQLRKPQRAMTNWENFMHSISLYSACSPRDIARLLAELLPCALLEGCIGQFLISDKKGLACLTQKCTRQITRMQADCLSCIPLMLNGVEDVFEACVSDAEEKQNKLNGPGLVLMSKTPMKNVEYSDFFQGKQLVLQRGFIQAEVDGVGQVVCTHLTSVFNEYWEFDTEFSSFLEQQREEIQVLMKKFGSMDHLLVGDLNTGPSRLDLTEQQKNLTEEVPGNFQMLQDAGYSTPFLEDDGRCTYCSHNPLVNSQTDKLIDHVLGRGLKLSNTMRVMDRVEPRPLSDHFGMQADVCT